MNGWNAGHRLDNGRYTIEKLLGKGGFGLTYLGRDNKGNFVVIKTINEEEIPKNFLNKIRNDQDNKPGFYRDVYGLAATLYFMLTHVIPPDAGRRSYEILSRKIDPLKVPNDLNPNVSVKITQGIMKGLAISPKYRAQTVEYWMNLLPNSSSNASVNNPCPSTQNPVVSPPVTPPDQNQPITKNKKKLLKIKFISLGILGLLGLTGGGIYLLNSQGKYNLFSSPCPSTYESSSKVINVCNPNYLNDGIIPGLSGGGVALTHNKKELITYGRGGIRIWSLQTVVHSLHLETHSK